MSDKYISLLLFLPYPISNKSVWKRLISRTYLGRLCSAAFLPPTRLAPEPLSQRRGEQARGQEQKKTIWVSTYEYDFNLAVSNSPTTHILLSISKVAVSLVTPTS